MGHRLLAPTPGRPEGRTAVAWERLPARDRQSRQATGITAPARLLVDTLQERPAGRHARDIHARRPLPRHLDLRGALQGALAHATATPYNQFSIPAEAATGADGWATLAFQRLSGFPVSRHQQLIAMFVRARKPGENLLAGISTRRLVSIRVTRPA